MLNKTHVKSQLSLNPSLLIIHSDICLLMTLKKKKSPQVECVRVCHVSPSSQYATFPITNSTAPGLSVSSSIMALSSVCYLVLLICCQCCNSINVCSSVYSSHLFKMNIGWYIPVIPDIKGWSIPSQKLVWTTQLDLSQTSQTKYIQNPKKEKNNLSAFHMYYSYPDKRQGFLTPIFSICALHSPLLHWAALVTFFSLSRQTFS